MLNSSQTKHRVRCMVHRTFPTAPASDSTTHPCGAAGDGAAAVAKLWRGRHARFSNGDMIADIVIHRTGEAVDSRNSRSCHGGCHCGFTVDVTDDATVDVTVDATNEARWMPLKAHPAPWFMARDGRNTKKTRRGQSGRGCTTSVEEALVVHSHSSA
jgi:hypothetical protein